MEKQLTNKEWLQIFPETISDYIIPKIVELIDLKKETEKIIRRELEIIRVKSKPENHWFWEMYVEYWEVADLIEIEKQISHFKHLLALSENKPIIIKGRITDEMIKEAKLRPIEMVVSPVVRLRKSGRNFSGLCPFHLEKHPSFYIFTDTNRFHCFSCQKSGGAIDFIMEYYNLPFKEAVKSLIN